MGRLVGQIIDGGVTRKRLQMPLIEKPISWVDMTNSHWSILGMKRSINGSLRASADKRTSKTGMLIKEDPLAEGLL